MSLITFGTDLVDVCDVDIVATTGSTCMVYFQDGSYVASSLTAAAQAAAVNGTAEGALLTTVVTSTNFGTCYIAGQHVKRVRAAGADSIWDMCSGLGPVYVSGVDVTAAGVLIDATGECGGGGGGGAFFASPTNYEPTITETAGLTTTAQIAFVRAGEGSEPSSGDWMYLYGYLEIDSALVGNGQISFPLPVNGETGAGYSVTFYDSEATAFQIGTDFEVVTINATFAAQTYYTNFSVSYQVEGE